MKFPDQQAGHPLPPMSQRRPRQIDVEIENRFKNLQADVKPDYFNKGELPIYTFELGDMMTNTKRMLSVLESQKRRRLRILDIGAGAGRFVLDCLKEGHEAQAISAHDFRDQGTATKVPDEAYILGDANDLSGIPGLHDEYDLIVSRKTLMHLVDPLGALEQAANMVGPGGILAVDDLTIGISDHYMPRTGDTDVSEAHVSGWLENAGYVTTGLWLSPSPKITRYTPRFLSRFVGQRDDSALEASFPVGYNLDKNTWSYALLQTDTTVQLTPLSTAQLEDAAL